MNYCNIFTYFRVTNNKLKAALIVLRRNVYLKILDYHFASCHSWFSSSVKYCWMCCHGILWTVSLHASELTLSKDTNANTEYPALLNIQVDWPSQRPFPPPNFDHLQYVQIKSYHVILITSLLAEKSVSPSISSYILLFP